MSPKGIIMENQTVTLACGVPQKGTTTTEIRYNWYKNQQPLEDAHSATLRLHPVSRADTGFYFCEVSNAWGRERSKPVSLVVSCK